MIVVFADSLKSHEASIKCKSNKIKKNPGTSAELECNALFGEGTLQDTSFYFSLNKVCVIVNQKKPTKVVEYTRSFAD